jgi:hypothetical protein
VGIKTEMGGLGEVRGRKECVLGAFTYFFEIHIDEITSVHVEEWQP